MPANLTPQYRRAEEKFRRAQTAQERIQGLELMLQLIPRHKGTDRLQGELRARLKEARNELQAELCAPRAGKSYRIPRQGAGTVVVVGAPNSGKSRLLQALTNAAPEVAPYPFTTREPLSGMMTWEDLSVQLIDTPPIARGHFDAYLTGFVRSADAVVLCLDGSSDDAPRETWDVLHEFRERKTLLSDHSGFDAEDFSVIHVRTLGVVTRGLDPGVDVRLELLAALGPVPFPLRPVELGEAAQVEWLRAEIAQSLNVIRVYTKRPGRPADFDSPFTIPAGGTVEDLALKVHEELAASLRFAKVWSRGARDGQAVKRDHVLGDGDVVELHS